MEDALDVLFGEDGGLGALEGQDLAARVDAPSKSFSATAHTHTLHHRTRTHAHAADVKHVLDAELDQLFFVLGDRLGAQGVGTERLAHVHASEPRARK